jgi:hypothetical protein
MRGVKPMATPRQRKKSTKVKSSARPIASRTAPAAFEAVRQIARTLPNVEDGASYGTAALKVNGAVFIRLREDDDTLVLRCPVEDRDALIAEDPDTYFLTDHYLNYPWVLARMSTINPAALRDVVIMAHHNALDDKRKTTNRPARPASSRKSRS